MELVWSTWIWGNTAKDQQGETGMDVDASDSSSEVEDDDAGVDSRVVWGYDT